MIVLVYLRMIYKYPGDVNMTRLIKKILTRKEMSVLKSESLNNIKGRLSTYLIFSGFQSFEMNIVNAQIDIDLNSKHTVNYRYLTIDGVPTFFILSDYLYHPDSYMSFFEADEKIAAKLWALQALKWAHKYGKIDNAVYNIQIILDRTYALLDKAMELIQENSYKILYEEAEDQDIIKYEDIPEEIIETLKKHFMDNNYDEAVINYINYFEDAIIEELGIQLKKDETLLDRYYNDKNVISYIDKAVMAGLKNEWDQLERDNRFRDKVITSFSNALFFAKKHCSTDKIQAILFNNQMQNDITLDIIVNNKKFVIRALDIIKDIKGFINWLCGAFNLYHPFIPYGIMTENMHDEFSEADIYNIDFGKLISFEAKYDKDNNIYISNLEFDCIAPNRYYPYSQIGMEIEIHCNKEDIVMLLNNNRLLFYLLTKFGKQYILAKRFMSIYNSLSDYLLICNLLVPIEYSIIEDDEYEDE